MAAGRAIMAAGGLDVGGIEYLEAEDGRHLFYDVNANSNVRGPIGLAFGFDPFERVVDFLVGQLRRLKDDEPVFREVARIGTPPRASALSS